MMKKAYTQHINSQVLTPTTFHCQGICIFYHSKSAKRAILPGSFCLQYFYFPLALYLSKNMCNILQQCDFYGFYYSSVALVKSPFSQSVSFGCSPLPTSAIICKLSSPSKSYSAKKSLLCYVFRLGVIKTKQSKSVNL